MMGVHNQISVQFTAFGQIIGAHNQININASIQKRCGLQFFHSLKIALDCSNKRDFVGATITLYHLTVVLKYCKYKNGQLPII